MMRASFGGFQPSNSGYGFDPSLASTAAVRPSSSATTSSLLTKRKAPTEDEDDLFSFFGSIVDPEDEDGDWIDSLGLFDSDSDEPSSSLLSLPAKQEQGRDLFQEQSKAQPSQPYASVDFFHALRCMINDGVVHADFVDRMRHPESIQMLKVLKYRNDRRRETQRAAVSQLFIQFERSKSSFIFRQTGLHGIGQ